MTFTRLKATKAVHIKMDNITAMKYFLKMGGGGREKLGNESNMPGNLSISNK